MAVIPDVVNHPEDTPPPSTSCISVEETNEAIQGVAQALASFHRPIHPRCQSVLLQEAQNLLHADVDRASRRNPITPLNPIEQSLLSEHSIPGAKVTYRLTRDLELDYGEYATNEYAQGMYLVSKQFVEEHMRSKNRCRFCNRIIKYEIYGNGAASTFTGRCRNNYCVFDKIRDNDCFLMGKYYQKINLGIT